MIVVVLLGAYLILCVRSFRAEQLAHSGNVDDLIHATRFEPENAMNWRRLGLLRLYQQNDPEGAAAAFQRVLQINSHDADSWIGTAYALQLLNRPDEERFAIANALEAEPKRLEISWQAANLYAVLGDRGSMIQQVCELLQHDRARSDAALGLARKITGSKTVNCEQQGNPE